MAVIPISDKEHIEFVGDDESIPLKTTVGDLRKALDGLPDDMLIGAEDGDEVVCEVACASATSDDATGNMYFLIRAKGGHPLFEDDEED